MSARNQSVGTALLAGMVGCLIGVALTSQPQRAYAEEGGAAVGRYQIETWVEGDDYGAYVLDSSTGEVRLVMDNRWMYVGDREKSFPGQ